MSTPIPPTPNPAKVVPVTAATPHHFLAKIGAWILIGLGQLAAWLPTALPQLQHDYPNLKWGSIASGVGVVWMIARNIQESGTTQPTNFSLPTDATQEEGSTNP